MNIGSVMHQLFGKAPTQNPQATPVVAGGQPNASNNPMKQGEPSVKTNDGQVPLEEKPVSPVAEFAKVWETTPVDQAALDAAKASKITPQQIMEAAGKVDYSKILNKDKLAELSKGGEGAATALIDLLNQAAQASSGQSSVVAMKLIEDAVRNAQADFARTVPITMRNNQAKENLFAENPHFNDPAVKPIVEAVVLQLGEKFPKASQKELETQAMKMIIGTADVLKPTPTETNEGNVQNDTNWDKYFEGAADVFSK